MVGAIPTRTVRFRLTNDGLILDLESVSQCNVQSS